MKNLNVTVMISCGGHKAETCSGCGNESALCNGDCVWDANAGECKSSP